MDHDFVERLMKEFRGERISVGGHEGVLERLGEGEGFVEYFFAGDRSVRVPVPHDVVGPVGRSFPVGESPAQDLTRRLREGPVDLG